MNRSVSGKVKSTLGGLADWIPRCVGEVGACPPVKVQPTLTKVLQKFGCLYLAIIRSNYSRLIVPVKKLQFPPRKTNKFESVKVCSCTDMPHHEGHAYIRAPCCYVRDCVRKHIVQTVYAYYLIL